MGKTRVLGLMVLLLLIATMNASYLTEARKVAMLAESHRKMGKDGYQADVNENHVNGDNHHYYSIPDFNRRGGNDQGDTSPGRV
ncbi:AP-3 complex subunit delta [Dorcoceras hygrometricum]|uniref:AP-3 complex subunit delta n=1 Tax=Dorcoceras hygrometricum TaxID=472368 RepID=A0A2Z7BZ99_9LAMI|nr:AP-3 complex subunit delta [Dorcoceras hygrometricum]